jgi:hypothetical protein
VGHGSLLFIGLLGEVDVVARIILTSVLLEESKRNSSYLGFFGDVELINRS